LASAHSAGVPRIDCYGGNRDGAAPAHIGCVFLDQFSRVAADDENPFALLNERRIGNCRAALGGAEAGTGQDGEARVFGEVWVGETELAEKEHGVASGGNFARVNASGTQAGVFCLFLGLILLLCDGHFMCADKIRSDCRCARRAGFHILG
jgi:hypothetical protein